MASRVAWRRLAVGPEGVVELLKGLDDVWPVNWNGPSQTVISGTARSVAIAVVERARSRGLRAQPIAVAGAFHAPVMGAVEARLTSSGRGTDQGSAAMSGLLERQRRAVSAGPAGSSPSGWAGTSRARSSSPR